MNTRCVQIEAGRAVFAAVLMGGVLAGCASSEPRSNTLVDGVTRVDLGGTTITLINDGFLSRPLGEDFVRNVSLPEVKAALEKAGLPTDKVEIPFNPLVADIQGQRVLFDAGNGELGVAGTGLMLERMKNAGIPPESITAVVVSHFHGDHINGLRNKSGDLVFPNARIYVPSAEWDWWMNDANIAATVESSRGSFSVARRVFGSNTDSVQKFSPGAEILPGIKAIEAYGHTPGHTAFLIEGANRKLLYWADVTNIPVLFLRNLDWAVRFDMDAERARLVRHQLAEMSVRESLLVSGYHFPDSAIGKMSKQKGGYVFHPLP